MFQFEKITTPASLEQYRESYSLRSGRETPSKLLATGDSYTVHACGTLVGGFSINHTNNLRTVGLIPSNKDVAMPKGKLAEINALWLEPSLWLRIATIAFLFITLHREGVDEVVAYTTRTNLFHHTYETFGGVALYQGPLANKTKDHGIVFKLKPQDIVLNLPKYLAKKGKRS